MTDRKKNASRSQVSEASASEKRSKVSEREVRQKTAGSVPAPASSRPSRQDVTKGANVSAREIRQSTAGSVPAPSRTERQSAVKSETGKNVKVVTREEKRTSAAPVKAAVRQDAKNTGGLGSRLRNSALGRFIYEAFYELRHKVTWPTFREARNMTFVVLALSIVIGLILAAADFGLHRLFLLIIGAQ